MKHIKENWIWYAAGIIILLLIIFRKRIFGNGTANGTNGANGTDRTGTSGGRYGNDNISERTAGESEEVEFTNCDDLKNQLANLQSQLNKYLLIPHPNFALIAQLKKKIAMLQDLIKKYCGGSYTNCEDKCNTAYNVHLAECQKYLLVPITGAAQYEACRRKAKAIYNKCIDDCKGGGGGGQTDCDKWKNQLANLQAQLNHEQSKPPFQQNHALIAQLQNKISALQDVIKKNC